MSKIAKELRLQNPKKQKSSKQLLIDLERMPEAWRWLERQAHIHGCSKTAYIKALVEVDRKEKDE